MIGLSVDGAVATVTIDRGSAGNAFALAGWDALAAAAGAVAASGAHAAVLRSAHPTLFSAGADLAEMRALVDPPARRADFRLRMRAAIEGVAALPMPVIAAVDGGCFGAAVALVLACDVRVAGDRARFATTPATLGIGYPGGDVARLAARVGRGQAARMLFTGAAIDADEARCIGLVELRAPDAAAEASRVAARIAANAPAAVAMLKRTLADPSAPGVDAAFDGLFGTPEFAARLAAFHTRAR